MVRNQNLQHHQAIRKRKGGNEKVTKGLKDTKLYLSKIRQDQFKIKNLVDYFLSFKRPRDQSTSSDSATDTKLQDIRASSSSSHKADEVKMDRNRSLSQQHDRELSASLGVNSHRSSSASRQGREMTIRRANVNNRTEDTMSSSRESFAGVMSPLPALESPEFNWPNPSPGEALSQDPKALWKVQAFSLDNLAAVAGNTMPPATVHVSPPFTPPG